MTDKVESDVPYADIDPGLGEELYPNEQALAVQIADAIEAFIRRRYRAGQARRDAHRKAHGIVKAEFRVNDAIPSNLVKGIFIPGQVYPAWIRFSNGLQDDDTKGDARGMAIKLLDVPGEKLLENARNATTQDFILFSGPVFFLNDPLRYLALTAETTHDCFWSKLLEPLTLGPKGTLIAEELNRGIASNPLQVRYWSAVPSQFGIGPDRQAVKYSVMPDSAASDPLPGDSGPDYLRAALRATLQNGEASMTFLVQPRTADDQSVEDSTTEWREDDAPFYPVASIHIPRQDFDTPQQNQFAEDVAFSPWHGLPEHRPLGVTNRLRKIIYDRTSRVRHEINSV